LRLSVATLVRVLFNHPKTGQVMLALERKATVFETADERQVRIRAQPFGGAVQLRNPKLLEALIGAIHFDSERSRAEQDFRILIQPADWQAVRQFCLQHLAEVDDPVLDSGPARELAEEFADALNINLLPDQYTQQPKGLIIEDRPTPTDNPRASGHSTVRIYKLYETLILDAVISQTMLANSEHYSDRDLHEQALTDLRAGGRGRATAVLALPLKLLTESYLGMSPEARVIPTTFHSHKLDRNVPAILEGVPVPGYTYL